MTAKAKSKIVTVGLVQMRCRPRLGENLKKAVGRIREAAARGAQVVCLQELFRSQYFCQSEDVAMFKLAETIPGPTTAALSGVAREEGVAIVVPLFEKRAEGLYHNSAVVIDADGRIAGQYRKMHVPDDPLYYEKFYFTPGDMGFPSHSTRFAKISVLVCWDQWFPEGARLAALSGAELLFYPTAIGWLPGEKEETNRTQHEAWETVQRAHAVANGLYVAAVNRVGCEGGLTFWGQSFVADPMGRILARASSDKEEVLVVPCDLSRIGETRRHWPFLRDRRIDAYDGLTRRLLEETPHRK
ncbi:MAG: carbon-nitrogen hydrolase [Acidobacteria bacterium]|nr:carbon-nitrogen hydrolase [Acidobacteriota bacterium]